MTTFETNDQPTPNGGTHSVIYYMDDDGEPADKETATGAKVVDLDADEHQVFRTYFDLNGRGDAAHGS